MSRICSHVAYSAMVFAMFACIGCVSSSDSGTPGETGTETVTPSGPAPVPSESGSSAKSFEKKIKTDNISVTLIDEDFATQLNQATRDPLFVQHGKILKGTVGLVQTAPHCKFVIRNGFASTRFPYLVDRDSLRQAGYFGSYYIQFSIGKLIGVECGNATAGSPALTDSDFDEIFGNLLTVNYNSVETPSSPGLGKKIELLETQAGTPSIGVQFSPADKAVSITLSIQGNQLVGNKPDGIGPSYLAVMDKESKALYGPWTSTHISNSSVILPGSSQSFTISIDKSHVREVIQSFRKSGIVFSVKSATPSPSFYIDLGELCSTYPGKFMNLDSGETGCP